MQGLQAPIQTTLHDHWDGESPLVVAVSTGVDSMLLLHALEELHYPIVVAHVNHHLRAQSNEEAEFLIQYCHDHHLRLQVADWNPSDHPTKGLEKAARQFRYQFFAQIMAQEKSQLLLTAHHQNDLAETVLMKLVRGGWLQSIVGMQASRPFAGGWLVRPWLQVPKAEIIKQARQLGLTWYEDATNQSLTIQRNRYRNQILPLLSQEDAQVIPHLGDFHDQLTKLLNFAEGELAKYDQDLLDHDRLKVGKFNKLPAGTQELYLKHYFQFVHQTGVTKAQLTQSLRLLTSRTKPQGRIQLTDDWQLVKVYQAAWLQKTNQPVDLSTETPVTMIELEHRYSVADGFTFCFSWQDTGRSVAWFELTPAQLPLTIRPWQAGDRLRLKNGGHQKIHRLLIDQKVPLDQRAKQMVIVDQFNQVLWLVGRKTAWLPKQTTAERIYLYYQGDNHDNGKWHRAGII